jgi:hypothetical protein
MKRIQTLQIICMSLLAWVLEPIHCTHGGTSDNAPWSFSPLMRPPLPDETLDSWTEHPVDRFIARRLQKEGLTPSPPAERHQLLRRVFNDVWGMPPLPEDLEWLRSYDVKQDWSRLVNRLLASPHYGERWARHWMDIVHFAETHGHDEDAPREHAWPYRDYLIQSLNADKPYDQFAREQLAGDILIPARAEALTATGFLAAGPWDESSQMGIQDGTLDKKLAQYLDRDDMITTTMSSFLGITAHCARCHDHKFDPISIEDYYALQAVFAGVDRHDRPYDLDTRTHRQRQSLLALKSNLLGGRYPESALTGKTARAKVKHWIQSRHQVLSRWKTGTPQWEEVSATQGMLQASDGSIFFEEPSEAKGSLSWTFQSPHTHPTAIQLEVLPDDRLPKKGPGWAENGNFRLSEFEVFWRSDATMPWKPVTLQDPRNDFSEHTTSVRYLIDGDASTDWGILPQTGQPHRCYFEIKAGLDIKKDHWFKIVLSHQHGNKHWLGRCRVRLTDIPTGDIHPFLHQDLQQALDTTETARTHAQQLTLARHATLTHWDGLLEALPSPSMVYAATSFFPAVGNFKPALGPREVRRLARGSIHSPGEIVPPGALSQMDWIPWNPDEKNLKNEGERRLALAQWVTHHDNALFWRTMANRIWQYHFGSPLVSTPNDLGNGGQVPSHPELLDWLACELRASGGSMKHLHRLLLNSQSYRQQSVFRENAAQVDAANRYYWRMTPRRLEAEAFRDTLLALTGSLDTRMGGPSVKQFHMRPGIHVTPVVDYQGFSAQEPAMARRSVYRFLFRTLPDPFMKAMDCPDASNWTPRRNVSIGPLQALALMNDDFIIRQSQLLANALEKQHTDLGSQVSALFQRSLLRAPDPMESKALEAYARQHGMHNACRYFFNSNAFLFVE